MAHRRGRNARPRSTAAVPLSRSHTSEALLPATQVEARKNRLLSLATWPGELASPPSIRQIERPRALAPPNRTVTPRRACAARFLFNVAKSARKRESARQRVGAATPARCVMLLLITPRTCRAALLQNAARKHAASARERYSSGLRRPHRSRHVCTHATAASRLQYTGDVCCR